MKTFWVATLNVIALVLAFSGVTYGNSIPVKTIERFGKFPVYFVENRGQLDSRVAYYAPGLENTLYFENNGLTFLMHPQSKSADRAVRRVSLNPDPKDTNSWAVKLEFVGANERSQPKGLTENAAVFNYFRGAREDWKTGVKTYNSLKYSNLWPGIDLMYSGTSNQVKYSFILQPGADPDQIQLLYKGVTEISIEETGELRVATPLGSFQDGVPIAYQEINGQQKEVTARYSLQDRNKDGSYGYGFQLGSYDPTKPLILDPAIFLYSGFLGGDNDDYANSVAIDLGGNAYIAGSTTSNQTTFPVAAGPYFTYSGATDGFIAKISPNATLVYTGYIGGTGFDHVWGVTVDIYGNAYVTGATLSETGFPIVGRLGKEHHGSYDAFVAKIDKSGTYLHYSGYIGGTDNDGATGIAVDDSGNVYIVGGTESREDSFPVTVGPDLTFNGYQDGFVCKIDYRGSALVYCGYIGGADEDVVWDIAVQKGVAFVTGYTSSDQSTFPVLNGPDLTFNGMRDAFVARILPTGSRLFYAGYIGGAYWDATYSIAVDGSGNSYIAGFAESDQTTFPVLNGPDLTFNGQTDAFISKISSTGTANYCGYIGGSGSDAGAGIALDSSGNVYITGYTESDQTTFPVIDGPDLTFNGYYDGFIARLNAGFTLEYCGYIGGVNGDFAYDVAVDVQKNAYVVGSTNSTETTFPVLMGPDLTYNGGEDAFITKISPP